MKMHATKHKQFTTKIRDARTARGLTQREVGEKIGVPSTIISGFETGRGVSIANDKLEKLAKLFKTTTRGLFAKGTTAKRTLTKKKQTATTRQARR